MHRCDVTDQASVQRFRQEVTAQHGKVTLLFNNAGVGARTPLVHAASTTDTEVADFEKTWDFIFNVCFFGVLHCTRAFLPLLQQAASSGEAYIVNTSSVLGLYAVPELGSYASAKYAVKGFTESLLAECAMKHPTLHVASVHPGGVRTEIVVNGPRGVGETQAKRDEGVKDFAAIADLSSEEAAAWILSGVARNSTRILVGYDAHLLDLATRLGPRWCYKIFTALGQAGCQPGTPPTRSQLLRALLGGGWYMALMMSPMAILRTRRHPAFRPIAIGGATAAAYAALGALRSKL